MNNTNKHVEAEAKRLAEHMLYEMENTPAEPVRIHNDLLTSAEFTNGFARPNQKPPVAVYIEISGKRWRLQKMRRWEHV